MYNVSMKKGKLKEEDTVKISITVKRAEEEFDRYISEKLMVKKKRMKSN
jgi:hypothetical protein